MRSKRRFIAGAVCPKCKAMDRIVLIITGEIKIQECVNCGFKQSQNEKRDSTQIKNTDISQPVRIIDPNK